MKHYLKMQKNPHQRRKVLLMRLQISLQQNFHIDAMNYHCRARVGIMLTLVDFGKDGVYEVVSGK